MLWPTHGISLWQWRALFVFCISGCGVLCELQRWSHLLRHPARNHGSHQGRRPASCSAGGTATSTDIATAAIFDAAAATATAAAETRTGPEETCMRLSFTRNGMCDVSALCCAYVCMWCASYMHESELCCCVVVCAYSHSAGVAVRSFPRAVNILVPVVFYLLCRKSLL